MPVYVFYTSFKFIFQKGWLEIDLNQGKLDAYCRRH